MKDNDNYLASLFKIAVINRVDFFELLRSSTLEEYNRENPLCPLSTTDYLRLKSDAIYIMEMK